jgi:hypothetical protein
MLVPIVSPQISLIGSSVLLRSRCAKRRLILTLRSPPPFLTLNAQSCKAKRIPNMYADRPRPEARKASEKAKTYNSGDSLVVTHLTTNPPVQCLSTAERTGSSVFIVLWSYVLVSVLC